ncbi:MULTISPECIES: Hpt domain-containing protein [Pseudomonas]|jgi:chemosensory pili system protein ChpA (sensor histidine kinase/response regulator)|uniref:Hpt domain-containing protein n=1 Tax=Pseudomonas TaxID=286 RepID=UPI000B359E28|nr:MULTISPECIES: Hpt domain-containing protein [Pseudomonas]MBD9605838.1 Hpt domain-containing protein [Pseudomonas sp. PDM08]MDR7106886.1 chemosensory pili system protein ChpA (sensor histidine kinase/response regulator) [Pseudomonas frederiksbergensis]PMY53661.1 hybrid sensor histidine kinase/response regulator [Pseudomonas sp. FW305-53]PMY87611.1 hybrid sensor histidine kinase/response regulator [Pseudomonas sp. FW303-C2]PMY94485.1 hybrid sensor histidine kinase/response regulator [Pseudomo
MGDRHDYVALEWVKGEIAETLKQAHRAIETLIDDPQATHALSECLACVHQVHGSLQMVEFYGAALLAEEIEQLTCALQQNRVSHRDEAIRLLLHALGQLPTYLDRVQGARRDLPLVVLPLINDLRSARGESLLSETSLFSPQLPELPPLSEEALALLEPSDLPDVLRKLRQMLQMALVGLLREQDDETHLAYLARVFARLEGLCGNAPLSPLWHVASALVEGMRNGSIANSPALRSLFKDADKELKRLLEQGMPAINQPAPPELLKSLLFYIAKAEHPTGQMLTMKDRYSLDDALPDSAMVDEERARLAGPDRDAMRSVLAALCEELVRVKERLDLFVRSDRQHTSDLESLLAPLRQIADTLAVLGFGQPRKVIIDQLAVVLSLAQGQREPNDATLMDVAGALLYVEATLAGMVGTVEPESQEDSRLPTTDLTQIHQIVIKEARICLQQAKDMIVDYIDADWDRQHLQPLPALLTQVRGALAMIPLARAASLVEACNGFIREHLLVDPGQPGWQQLDSLADVITSIEYYLERLSDDPEAPGEQLLDVAEKGLAALGCFPSEQHVPKLEDVLSPSEALVMQDMQELDDPETVQSLADVLASPVSSVNPPALTMPGSLLPPPADEQPVDDELREVFLEETDEVLEILQEYLPRWSANPDSTSVLSELRRAFHTLKGSGRMVRALVLGELAWAVENLLNRVLEHSVAPLPAVQQLVGDALKLLPELVAEFAANAQRQRNDVDQLAARAHALAKGYEPLSDEDAQDVAALDPLLLEIFRNEAETHLNSLNRFLDQAAEHVPLQASDELQRALHTLKGSASMAGVLPIAELAASLDQLAREYKAHRIALDLDEVELLLEAEGLFRLGLRQLKSDPLAEIPGARSLIERTRTLLAEHLQSLSSAPGTGLRIKRDPQLINNFLAQGMDILLDAESLLQRWQQHPGERQELSALLDELTTLGEGAHLADLHPVDELCEALLDLYGAVEESSLAVSDRFFHEAQSAHEALINMLDELAAGQEVTAQPQRVRALRDLLDESLDPSAMGLIRSDGSRTLSIRELGSATAELEQAATEVDLDDEIVSIFLEEAVDILESAGQALQRWLSDPENAAPLLSLQRDLHTLKGGARMAEVEPVGDLAHELESLYEGLVDRRYSHSEALAQLLQQSHDRLAVFLEQLQHNRPLGDPGELIEAIREFRLGNAGSAEVIEPAASNDSPGHDPELLDIFLEEGFDIIENSGAALLRWQAEPSNRQEVETLLRDLHTLKGGARMVEIATIGDLAHELEFLYEGLSAGALQPTAALFTLLQSSHDRLAQMLDATRAGQPLPPADQLIEAIKNFSHPAVPETPTPAAMPAAPKAEPAALQPEGADTVKVSAELLDDLVNLAGETSIFRGRIEQQVNDARVALSEMETTIERMRDQLRRLDTETQGRILSRQQVEAERLGYEEFDPLEMDRHSQLQQLSRALFESASDLLDLKETLDRRNQDAENLLQQQGRINTELQEGLMRTRMVPFERMLPRLKRIVRQVSSELGKDVEFIVGNAEGEMDRNVLERMAAPLEHMLRNAVDHGLESAEVRIAAGKPAQGKITLDLSREGGDIIFDICDDGAGVPLDAVRRKAIKRGLLAPDSDISDRDVLQFILQPGFSTAEKITQISGRGVGMDVVHEEVRQLGGTMSIDSTSGQGVHFRIRLPFTVSVNRALMVQCGEDQYAIPLNTIDGIVRVLPNELEGHYRLDPPSYEYAGQRYELCYLGDLLKTSTRPKLLGQSLPLPVLLVQCNERHVAVQVDAMAGTREIVVKSLGPQFAAVQGLSGATILGDGRVVLILDLLAPIRAMQAQVPQRPVTQDVEPEAQRPLLVLVVDDSVTVRKVTSRLLERHGMNVLTAKDGVDAMLLLEEHMPDLMLLDIEMPRMDGFEVATQVRADERLQHLPIIMITSRTGQKHRDRAMAIGVNDYLGKPYQESVLLDSIARWSKTHA